MSQSRLTSTALTVLVVLVGLLALASSASAARSTLNTGPTTTDTVGADGQTCDDTFAARRDYATKLANGRPAASNESYLRELYRLMLICKSDEFAVDKIWIVGTKAAGVSLPEIGRLAGDEVTTNAKTAAKVNSRRKQARTLSCSASANNPVFRTVAGTRVVYAGGSITCNETAPLRGWVDLWRRYASTGTVVIPQDNFYGWNTSNALNVNTPDVACSSNSSYKSADVLMQRNNGSSWGGNTVLDTFWHAGDNYACP